VIINNAGSRRNVGFWTRHLQNVEENERAELKEIRGLSADNLRDALLEMQQEARCLPRLKNFMYHADFNPARHERLTAEQWDRAFEIFEQQRGIPAGQPSVVFEHEKDGRVHRHVIWTRVDHENQRATPDDLDWKVAHKAACAIENELGLEKVIGPLDREPGTKRPPRAPEPWEMYRGMKTKLDPRDIAAEVTDLYHRSENGKAFQAALAQHGYQLATGRRGLLILDTAGKEHSLARRIDGVNTKELNAFMRDVDREALPSVEEAKAQYQERKIAGLEADCATISLEIERGELSAKGAKHRAPAARAGRHDQGQGRENAQSRVRGDHWPANPPQPERQSPGLFEKAATEAVADGHPANLKGVAAQVWQLWTHVDHDQHSEALSKLSHDKIPFSVPTDPTAFATSLEDRGVAFAVVTKEESGRSHREAEFARAVGNYAPRFKEGEIVIVTEPRREYRRNGEITEPQRVHKIDQSLAEKFLKGLDKSRELTGIDATKEALNDKAQLRAAAWEAIRLENATSLKHLSRIIAADLKAGIHKSAGLAGNVLGGLGKTAEVLTDAFESLLSPKLSPEQIHQGEKATRERELEAERSIDFSRYTGDRAQQRQTEQEQQAARDRQREIERER
jgi:hypothetical protein